MLILSRHLNESIMIGENGEIEVKLISLNGNHVRLGIAAPHSIPVHRKEIFLRIQEISESEE